jgi:hypothetical protein
MFAALLGKGTEKKMAKTKHFGPLAAAAGVLVAVALLVLMLVVVNPQTAEAAFPGANGRIAYVGSDPAPGQGDFEIYTIPSTGGTPFQVTFNNRDDFYPVYSPDGTKIAYSGADEAAGQIDWEIFTINASGGGKFQVTHNTTHDVEPSWQPRP